MNWLELIIQLLTLIALICGIVVWRWEHIGKRQIELAEDTLALFYEAVDAIKYVRCPVVSLSNETDDILKGENESDKEFLARKNASIVYYKFTKYQELFSKLQALRYRFMAQIGKDKAKPFDELRSIKDEILCSARKLARLWSKNDFRNVEEREKYLAEVEKLKYII